jgi:hypothetical protein
MPLFQGRRHASAQSNPQNRRPLPGTPQKVRAAAPFPWHSKVARNNLFYANIDSEGFSE